MTANVNKEITNEVSENKSKISINSSIIENRFIEVFSKDKNIPKSSKYWKKEEDHLLITLQKQLGNNWVKISEKFVNRSPSQCFQRWRRIFSPMKVRKNWTEKEDSRLIQFVQSHGRKWKF